MNQYNVFSGVFSDETSQRFLRIMHECSDNAFTELYNHSMPQHPSQFKTCLDRVNQWDGTLIHDEFVNIQKKFPDIVDTFKQVYVNFVKSMRGGKTVKLMVSMPKFEDFLHSFFNQISKHKCMRSGKYYQQASLLDQRVTCLDAARDALFEFLGEEHVKLEDRSVISESSGVKQAHPPDSASNATYRNSRERLASEVSSVQSYKSNSKDTRVVSNVCSQPAISEDNDDDSVAPDDSVSNVDFADKQQRAIRRFIQQNPRITEDEEESEKSSKTSMSLSSVEISQSGIITKKPSRVDTGRYKGMADPGGNPTAAPFDEKMSEVSMRSENIPRPPTKRRSPVRSYVTSLTEED